MKKTVFFAMLFVSVGLLAQIKTPAASPASTLNQTVGLTDVTVEYSRPSAKSRTVYGDLVPYGKLWRTGANARTKISFSNDVKVAGKDLEKGSYALLTIPGDKKWDVIFYSETEGWGAPKEIDEEKVALRLQVTPIATAMFTESFHIFIDNLTNAGATLFMKWEKTLVPINFTVPTDKEVMANIDRVFSGPAPGDYFAAARYYYDEGKDIQKAKMWIDKSLAANDNPPFWQLRQKSLIYAAAGDKKGAIEAAKKSLAAAKEAGNDDYVKMNQDSLKEWGAM
mgnify:CR=1 FL=1